MSYAILKKLMEFVSLTETGTEVYITTITTAIFYSFCFFGVESDNFKCLKIKDYPRENVKYFYAAILVDAD